MNPDMFPILLQQRAVKKVNMRNRACFLLQVRIVFDINAIWRGHLRNIFSLFRVVGLNRNAEFCPIVSKIHFQLHPFALLSFNYT